MKSGSFLSAIEEINAEERLKGLKQKGNVVGLGKGD